MGTRTSLKGLQNGAVPSPGSASSQGTPLLADNNGLLFVETSALDSTNVEQAFETILKGTRTGAVVQQGPGDQGIAGSLIRDTGLGRGCAARLSSALFHVSSLGLVSVLSFWLVWFPAFLAGCFALRTSSFVLMAPGHP